MVAAAVERGRLFGRLTSGRRMDGEYEKDLACAQEGRKMDELL